MKYTGIIYRAYCLITKKCYIGQTRQEFKKRQSSHINESFNINNRSYDNHFHRAIRKYGNNNFEWTIIDSISSDSLEELCNMLDELEIKYISKFDSFNNGYNETTGGQNCIHSRKKIIIYNEEGSILKECKDVEDASLYLNTFIDNIRDTCCRKREFFYNEGVRYIIRYDDYILTKEELNKIKQLKYSQQIIMYNKDGKCIKIFNSVQEGSKELNIQNRTITDCCRKNRKSTSINGKIYTFRYKNDKLTQEDIKYLQTRATSDSKICAINSKNEEIIGIYDTFKQASDATGINVASINQCCKGKRKSAGKINGIKIIWKYYYVD